MGNEKSSFDNEFITDEEAEEMLDSIASAFAGIIDKQKEQAYIVNPSKVEQVLYAYEVLVRLAKGIEGAKVSYELYEPYASMGSVSVTGRSLEFGNSEWFMKAVELSGNLNVYPKTNGTVQMDFTFHGLVSPIEQ